MHEESMCPNCGVPLLITDDYMTDGEEVEVLASLGYEAEEGCRNGPGRTGARLRHVSHERGAGDAGHRYVGGVRMLTVVRLALTLAVAAILIALLVLWGSWRGWGCEGVDIEGLTEAEAASLVGRGWAGDPNDGREALYPSECLERS